MSPMLLIALLLGIGLTEGHDPPVPVPPQNPDPTVCQKRFEYEYNVMQKIITCEMNAKKIKMVVKQQHDQIDFMQDKLKELMQWHQDSQTSTGGGEIYTRWGRDSCPQNTELVYDGYVGGSYFAHQGGASNPVCLPKNPDWTNSYYDDNPDGHSAFMYGGEYEMGTRNLNAFFPTVTNAFNNNDVPCAVCCTKKSKVMMLPAKTQCPTGWGLEYKGYLSAGLHNSASASQYVCLDGAPQAVPGGSANTNGYLFAFVEARCGSLKCPPYFSDGRELTCAVCSQ